MQVSQNKEIREFEENNIIRFMRRIKIKYCVQAGVYDSWQGSSVPAKFPYQSHGLRIGTKYGLYRDDDDDNSFKYLF